MKYGDQVKRYAKRALARVAPEEGSSERARWAATPVLNTVMSHWGGQSKNPKRRLALFSTFDAQGVIAEYVVDYLRELDEAGFAVILVSTSPTLHPNALAEVRELTHLVVQRQNVGLDFASWKTALSLIGDWHDSEAILLVNDSVFGPFRPMSQLIEELDRKPEPVCGMSDSWERYYHLQSWFLYFKRETVASEAFRAFWHEAQIETDKAALIDAYEVGLSRRMYLAGQELGPLVSYLDLRDRALHDPTFQYATDARLGPLNPTLNFWDVLLRDFSFPFLKTEILKHNNRASLAIPRWREWVPAPKAELILRYLKRSGFNCHV